MRNRRRAQTDLESTLTSSPSTFRAAFGVTASRTKWLSQWGQYSSLIESVVSGSQTLEEKNGSRSRRSVRLFKFLDVFSECLLTLFADEGHVESLQERMIGLFAVAFGAIEPFLASSEQGWKSVRGADAICKRPAAIGWD